MNSTFSQARSPNGYPSKHGRRSQCCPVSHHVEHQSDQIEAPILRVGDRMTLVMKNYVIVCEVLNVRPRPKHNSIPSPNAIQVQDVDAIGSRVEIDELRRIKRT